MADRLSLLHTKLVESKKMEILQTIEQIKTCETNISSPSLCDRKKAFFEMEKKLLEERLEKANRDYEKQMKER